MASLLPQVMVTSLSGSGRNPLKRETFPATASRRAGIPQVMEYWLFPRRIA